MSGSASAESVQAIASCFGLNAADLIIEEPRRHASLRLGSSARLALIFTIVVSVVILSFASTRYASAKDVTLDFVAVITAEDDRYEHIGQMILDDGEESEFRMNGVFKILVTPKLIEESQILISLKIFAAVDGEYVLVSEPSLTTVHGKEAVLSVGLKDARGSRIRASITSAI